MIKKFLIKTNNGYLKNNFIKIKYNIKPTISRLIKKLFNWIAKKIKKSNCLDCYTGSGAIGIKALSCNASKVVFIDKNKLLTEKIKKNKQLSDINKKNIINTNTLRWLKKNTFKYDIIFIDPPFYKNIINCTIKLIIYYKFYKIKSLIYIESEINNNIYIPYNWYLKKKYKTKKISYKLYKCLIIKY